jgi:hypothetical protein
MLSNRWLVMHKPAQIHYNRCQPEMSIKTTPPSQRDNSWAPAASAPLSYCIVHSPYCVVTAAGGGKNPSSSPRKRGIYVELRILAVRRSSCVLRPLRPPSSVFRQAMPDKPSSVFRLPPSASGREADGVCPATGPALAPLCARSGYG